MTFYELESGIRYYRRQYHEVRLPYLKISMLLIKSHDMPSSLAKLTSSLPRCYMLPHFI